MTGDEYIRDLRVTTRRTIPVSNFWEFYPLHGIFVRCLTGLSETSTLLGCAHERRANRSSPSRSLYTIGKFSDHILAQPWSICILLTLVLGLGKNARAQPGSEGELEAISEAQRTAK